MIMIILLSETCSDKAGGGAGDSRAFKDSSKVSSMMVKMTFMIMKMMLMMMPQVATGEFHSLIVTGDGWSPGSHYRFLLIIIIIIVIN